MADLNDFTLVTFEKDRERAFEALLTSSNPVSAWVTSAKQNSLDLRAPFFQAAPSGAHEINLKLEDGTLPSGSPGDEVEVLFSLSEGRYLLRSKLVSVLPNLWKVARGGDLLRLQRRNDFRSSVPRGYTKTRFVLKSFKNHPVSPVELPLVDISAGGVRIQWAKAKLSEPAKGDALTATLIMPGAREMAVTGLIKNLHVATDISSGVDAGIAFQNVSVRDEQVLLQLCLQIRREFVSK